MILQAFGLFAEDKRIGLFPILVESGEWLDHSFSEEEIHNVMFQLNKEKALEPDGLTIALYQEC